MWLQKQSKAHQSSYQTFPVYLKRLVRIKWEFSGGVSGKEYPMQETQVQSLGQEDPPEEEMESLSSILARKTLWTEEPGRLHTVHGIAETRLSTHTYMNSSPPLFPTNWACILCHLLKFIVYSLHPCSRFSAL